MKEHIYALFLDTPQGRNYFYVGRSTREPEIRLGEHKRAAGNKRKTEDVYQFIRQRGIVDGEHVWGHEILCWVDEGNPNDYEDFYVVKLIRAGHKLQNMKAGDARRIAAIAMANSEARINSVADVKKYREQTEFLAGLRAEAHRRKVLGTAEPSARTRAMFDALHAERQEFIQREQAKAKKRAEQREKREREIAEHHARQRELYEKAKKDV